MKSYFRIQPEGFLDRGQRAGKHFELVSLERAVQGFAGDVIPVGSAFVVNEQHQPVVKPAGAEVVEFALDQGDQTDPAVADHSEGYQVGLASKGALGQMVVGHFR